MTTTKQTTDTTGWRVEVQTGGDSSWSGNALTFRSEKGAEAYAADLAGRWTAVSGWRVIAVADEPPAPGESTTVDWAEQNATRPDPDAPAWRVKL
jgi:hypothetical protein